MSSVLQTALVRGVLFLVFWGALIGLSPGVLAVGVVALGDRVHFAITTAPCGTDVLCGVDVKFVRCVGKYD